MAKILKRRGNNIEAGCRGAGRNGHLGDAFSTPGLGNLGKCRAFDVRKPEPPGDVGTEDSILRNQVFALE